METLSYSVRELRHAGGVEGERAALLDQQSRPLFYPNIYVTSQHVSAGAAYSTALKVLHAVGLLYGWADARELDVDNSMLEGDLLSLDQIEDLAYFLRLNSEAQRAFKGACKKQRKLSVLTRRLEVVRAPQPESYGVISAEEAAARCRAIADYLDFLASWRVSSMARRRAETRFVLEHGEAMTERLRSLAPRASSEGEDETLVGLLDKEVEILERGLAPTAMANPFPDPFRRVRNYLIWRFLLETGMRRGELRKLSVADIDYASHRVAIRHSKTLARTVPVSGGTSEVFHDFVISHWSRIPAKARSHGLLFTTKEGAHLSEDAIGRVLEVAGRKLLGRDANLTPHVLRRTWNDRFSSLVDSTPIDGRMSPEQERMVRSRLMGWANNSDMAGRYARRYLIAKADEFGAKLATQLTGE